MIAMDFVSRLRQEMIHESHECMVILSEKLTKMLHFPNSKRLYHSSSIKPKKKNTFEFTTDHYD